MHVGRRKARIGRWGAEPRWRTIPGLCEAAQSGSMASGLYQNGTCLAEAMISGRSAGRNAVRRACA